MAFRQPRNRGEHMICDLETLEALVYGGAILGGGGGGSMQEGLRLARLALEMGTPEIVPLTDVDPDQWVLTVSTVGAPAGAHKFVRPMDYVRAVEKVANCLGGVVGGLIQSEMGGLNSASGLVQSAVLGIPVIDAPCNGRAHPIALMGSLGLHKIPKYRSIQAACGGNPDEGRRVELLVEGDINRCSVLVREGSVQAGGMIAVARNPIRAADLRDRAAVGAVMETITLGRSFGKARGRGSSVEEAVAQSLGGEVVAREKVTRVELTTKGGFDVGQVNLTGDYELMFWNEYMLLEAGGKRLYTFPDLIATFDTATHLPVSTARIAEGDEVFVIAAKKDRLILGEGMRDSDLYRRVDDAVGRPVASYALKED
ncbi:MAG: DUF917 domain-containing protein [Planctomycetota bacterium]